MVYGRHATWVLAILQRKKPWSPQNQLHEYSRKIRWADDGGLLLLSLLMFSLVVLFPHWWCLVGGAFVVGNLSKRRNQEEQTGASVQASERVSVRYCNERPGDIRSSRPFSLFCLEHGAVTLLCLPYQFLLLPIFNPSPLSPPLVVVHRGHRSLELVRAVTIRSPTSRACPFRVLRLPASAK